MQKVEQQAFLVKYYQRAEEPMVIHPEVGDHDETDDIGDKVRELTDQICR